MTATAEGPRLRMTLLELMFQLPLQKLLSQRSFLNLAVEIQKAGSQMKFTASEVRVPNVVLRHKLGARHELLHRDLRFSTTGLVQELGQRLRVGVKMFA